MVREAGSAGDPDLLRSLAAEAVARRWMLNRGLPCWAAARGPGAKGRYSLVFRTGRRALVSPVDLSSCSFDDMAAAKCDYLIGVELRSVSEGRPAGYLELLDIRKPGDLEWVPDLMMLDMRDMDEFPELAARPRHFLASYIAGSLIILARGEFPVPPPSGVRGVISSGP